MNSPCIIRKVEGRISPAKQNNSSVTIRRGLSLPALIGIAIIVAFSGHYAWMKYQRYAWLNKTAPGIHKTGGILKESWRSATYPAFSIAGVVTPIRGKDKGLVIHAENRDLGDRVLASIHADEKSREIAHWLVCRPGDLSCKVTYNRLYFDDGNPFGLHEQFLSKLYIERRSVDIDRSSLPKLKSKIENSVGDHQLLLRDAARIRFYLSKGEAESATPQVDFEILCLQPVDNGISRTVKGRVDLQVGVSFEKPERTRIGLK